MSLQMTVAEEFETLKQVNTENIKKIETPKQKEALFWIHEIDYKERTVNLLESNIEV